MDKIEYDLTNNKTYYLDNNGNKNSIDLPNENKNNRYFSIYENGVLKSKEKIDPLKTALNIHKIKNLKDVRDAKEVLDNVYETMSNLNIIEDITINSDTKKVNLSIQNIPANLQKNLAIYVIISKDKVSEINQISSKTNFFIKDKDPVIGWYFDNSKNSIQIEYNIPKDSNNGEILIVQEPILYNNNNLIVNYRQTNCNSGEAQLFELDSLENSKIYLPNSGKPYKVCVSHITESLYANNLYNNIYLFNYKNNGNLTFDPTNNNFNQKTFISINNNSLEWDMKIQETNPNENYSCLGSINNFENSLFGDCEYNPQKRIWIQIKKKKIEENKIITENKTLNTNINLNNNVKFKTNLETNNKDEKISNNNTDEIIQSFKPESKINWNLTLTLIIILIIIISITSYYFYKKEKKTIIKETFYPKNIINISTVKEKINTSEIFQDKIKMESNLFDQFDK